MTIGNELLSTELVVSYSPGENMESSPIIHHDQSGADAPRNCCPRI